MVKRWIVRLLIVMFVGSLVLVGKAGSRSSVRAGEMSPVAYFPIVFAAEPTRIERFSGSVFSWNTWYEEPGVDGWFAHEGGRLVAYLDDNSAHNIAYPGWRPLGDFQIDVDVRFRMGRWLNGAGVLFDGDDDWSDYYSFLLAYNFDQHFWGFARAEDGHYDWITPIGGAPAFVRWWEEWNHLTIVSRRSGIRLYCNGELLPGASYDLPFTTNRLVALVATTYEWNDGVNEYDNFRLMPLSQPY
ncbi:MAG: hypothetical protein JXA09_02835 [Anaerolineae bacterium]|nr:hypothetical protein [Anaerolineae bacterium]